MRRSSGISLAMICVFLSVCAALNAGATTEAVSIPQSDLEEARHSEAKAEGIAIRLREALGADPPIALPIGGQIIVLPGHGTGEPAWWVLLPSRERGRHMVPLHAHPVSTPAVLWRDGIVVVANPTPERTQDFEGWAHVIAVQVPGEEPLRVIAESSDGPFIVTSSTTSWIVDSGADPQIRAALRGHASIGATHTSGAAAAVLREGGDFFDGDPQTRYRGEICHPDGSIVGFGRWSLDGPRELCFADGEWLVAHREENAPAKSSSVAVNVDTGEVIDLDLPGGRRVQSGRFILCGQTVHGEGGGRAKATISLHELVHEGAGIRPRSLWRHTYSDAWFRAGAVSEQGGGRVAFQVQSPTSDGASFLTLRVVEPDGTVTLRQEHPEGVFPAEVEFVSPTILLEGLSFSSGRVSAAQGGLVVHVLGEDSD